jgi:hypothetical protein
MRSSPNSKRPRKAGENQELETILDFLDLPYQLLRDLPGIQSQLGPSITGITQSASDSWSWRDIKRVDILDEVWPVAYLEEFHQIFSLSIRNHPLALPPPPLPDIDLYICSEKHAEIFLQKTLCLRVNIALQMIFDKFTSQSGDEKLSLFDRLPGFNHRPVYSPGLRSGSSSKNNAMVPDLWCHSFSDLMQKDPPFLVGDVKLHRKWNSSLGRSGNNDYEICYRSALAQVNFYMVIKKCMSAFVMTEREAVMVERVPGWTGWVKVSKPFVGPRDMSVALMGMCFEACSASMSHTEPASEPREVSSDAYYPREETEPPSSSSKPNQSTASYS